MPLSQTQLTQLQTIAKTMSDSINALVVDPAVDPLQTQLDAANAQVQSLTTENISLKAKLDAIKAARASEEAGETAADTARQQIDAQLA